MIKIRKIAKVTSLLMAFLLLVSTTGFSIDLHYCQGDIKSFSLFGTAKSCHAMAEKSHCEKKKTTCHLTKPAADQANDSEKSCCSNKRMDVSPDTDIQKVITEQLTETQTTFLSAFVAVFYARQILDLAQIIIPHQNYIPPLLDRDIPVLVQSFLL